MNNSTIESLKYCTLCLKKINDSDNIDTIETSALVNRQLDGLRWKDTYELKTSVIRICEECINKSIQGNKKFVRVLHRIILPIFTLVSFIMGILVAKDIGYGDSILIFGIILTLVYIAVITDFFYRKHQRKKFTERELVL